MIAAAVAPDPIPAHIAAALTLAGSTLGDAGSTVGDAGSIGDARSTLGDAGSRSSMLAVHAFIRDDVLPLWPCASVLERWLEPATTEDRDGAFARLETQVCVRCSDLKLTPYVLACFRAIRG